MEITYDNTERAHPWKRLSARRFRANEGRRTSKGKSKLEERHGGTPTSTVAMVHDFDIGIPATEFCIDDDEADGPIGGNAQNYQQEYSGEKAGLTQGVR